MSHRPLLAARACRAALAAVLLAAAGAAPAKAPRVSGAAGDQVPFSVIDGTPLKVHVGADQSFQILSTEVPGTGQIYPSDSAGTADMGWFVRAGGTLYAPDFDHHAAGSAVGVGSYVPFTPVSLSGVGGSGTTYDPTTVTVSSTLGASGLAASDTIEYVNGDNYFTKRFTLTNHAAAAQTATVFLGADIYLADDDAGKPHVEPASLSPGGTNCAASEGSAYSILLIPQTPADAYTARFYDDVWQEIGANALTDTVDDVDCEDNGAALQWNLTLAAGQSVTLLAATSFGDVPTIAEFDVHSVEPDSGEQGATLDVTIRGIGFLPETTFDFGSGIQIANLAIVDGETATATLTIAADAALGPRDVFGYQTGAGPVGKLHGGFTVTGGSTPPPPPPPPPPPGGNTTPVPALGAWSLLLLSLSLAFAAALAARPR